MSDHTHTRRAGELGWTATRGWTLDATIGRYCTNGSAFSISTVCISLIFVLQISLSSGTTSTTIAAKNNVAERVTNLLNNIIGRAGTGEGFTAAFIIRLTQRTQIVAIIGILLDSRCCYLGRI